MATQKYGASFLNSTGKSFLFLLCNAEEYIYVQIREIHPCSQLTCVVVCKYRLQQEKIIVWLSKVTWAKPTLQPPKFSICAYKPLNNTYAFQYLYYVHTHKGNKHTKFGFTAERENNVGLSISSLIFCYKFVNLYNLLYLFLSSMGRDLFKYLYLF